MGMLSGLGKNYLFSEPIKKHEYGVDCKKHYATLKKVVLDLRLVGKFFQN